MNPRRQIDALAREAERAIQAQREAVLPTDAELSERATVLASDVDRAISLWQTANRGTEVEQLLDDRRPSQGEQDG